MNARVFILIGSSVVVGFFIGAATISYFKNYENFVSFSVTDVAQTITAIVLGTVVASWMSRRSLRDSLAFSIYTRVFGNIVTSLDQLERSAGNLYTHQIRVGELNHSGDNTANSEGMSLLHALRELNNHINNLRILCEVRNSLIAKKALWKFFFDQGLRLKQTLTQDYPASRLTEARLSEVREISCEMRLRVMEIEAEISK